MSQQNGGLLEKGEYWQPAKDESQSLRDRWAEWTPEFLRKPTAPLRNRKTAWLDGLRGFAAFLVYWHHHNLWCHEAFNQGSIFEQGWGWGGTHYFSTFHFVRVFFAGGHFAVTVFFVISGYVLSAKPISLIHAGEKSKLADNISSALFRRWMRLYIPVIGTTLIYMTSWHAFGLWVGPHNPAGNWLDELWNWYLEFKQWSFIFRSGGEPWFTYNFHSWSIPVEFKGSIVVYTCLLAFANCTKNARLTCMGLLLVYFMYIVDGWYCCLFVSGMLLCDLDQLAEKGELPKFLAKLEPYKVFIFYHLFILSMFLGGIPSHGFDLKNLTESWGWYYLSYLKPQAVFDYKWFYLFFASTMMVASVPRLRWLKSFFETRFCQYLGKISFSLYLVHGPVLWILGDRLYAATGWVRDVHYEAIPQWVLRFPVPRWGPLGLELSFFVPQLILLPVTLWLAEVSTRTFDEPSTKFVQWALKKTLPEPTKPWNPGN